MTSATAVADGHRDSPGGRQLDAALRLALTAAAAGHHHAAQAGRDRATHASRMLTRLLVLIALLIAAFDLLLILIG